MKYLINQDNKNQNNERRITYIAELQGKNTKIRVVLVGLKRWTSGRLGREEVYIRLEGKSIVELSVV